MAVTGSVDIGPCLQVLSVNHDPTGVATDCCKGCIIFEESTGLLFRKTDDGSTTNVVEFAPAP